MDVINCVQRRTLPAAGSHVTMAWSVNEHYEIRLCSGQAAQSWRGAIRPGARLSENPCQHRLIQPKEDKNERNDSLEMSQLGTLNRDN